MVKRKQEIVTRHCDKNRHPRVISLDFGYVLYIVVTLKNSLCICMTLLNEEEKIESRIDRN